MEELVLGFISFFLFIFIEFFIVIGIHNSFKDNMIFGVIRKSIHNFISKRVEKNSKYENLAKDNVKKYFDKLKKTDPNNELLQDEDKYLIFYNKLSQAFRNEEVQKRVKFLEKPLYLCPVCMPSVWVGFPLFIFGLIYFIFQSTALGFLIMFFSVVVTFCLSGFIHVMLVILRFIESKTEFSEIPAEEISD